MITLTEFLLARITEDETLAHAAADDEPLLRSLRSITSAPVPGGEILHIVRWDPARVLAECEAKRQIVDRYQAQIDRQSDLEESQLSARICAAEYEDWTLLALALPYADHPDYRQEWRP